MIRPADQDASGSDPSPLPSDHDERVGEAIEAYLSLIERGEMPDPEEFAAKYPDLEDDVIAGLRGLELVNGLVGHLPGGSGASGSGRSDRAPGRSLESGRRIAGYRIVRELGRGGMGTVYEAVHIALDRPVALKILGSHAAPDSSARRRFLNEARTAARLHHTNIVPVFDVGQVGGLCYYAMQRIEGTGIDRVLRVQRRERTTQSGGRPTQMSSRGEGGRNQDTNGTSSPSNSSQTSKLRELWVRVSAGWLKRSPINDQGNLPEDDHGSLKTFAQTGRPSAMALGSRTSQERSLFNSTQSWNAESRDHSDLGRSQREMLRPNLLGLSRSASQGAGEILSEELDEAPTFAPPRGSAFYRWVAEVGLQTAEALTHAHHQGVIHRDVKPSNLLIDAKGTVWVTDFGLARRLADPSLTQHDSLLGTPRYMSPEQARPGAIDGRSDIFSLGGTLYELLTLRPAFDGKSAAELVEQIAKIDPPSPRSIDPRIPLDLETIVLKMLAKRPADRYSSAASLAEDLARFLNHEPVKARRISPVGRLWRVARRHPGITGVSTAAAAAILAVATYAHVRVVNELDRNVALLRTTHWQNAVLLRLSPGLPGRRARALDQIKQAAALNPDPDLKGKLRDETVETMFVRDVEKSAEMETGRVRGLLFGSAGNRLAALADREDGEHLVFWDTDQNIHGEAIPLDSPAKQSSFNGGPENVSKDAAARGTRPGSETSPAEEHTDSTVPRRPAANAGTGGNTPGQVASSPTSRPGPGGPGRFRFSRMTSLGRTIAVILPSDRQARLFEAFSRSQEAFSRAPREDTLALALAGRTYAGFPAFGRLAIAEGVLSVLSTRDRGLRLIDSITGEKVGDLHTPSGNLVGVYGGSNGRFLTVDLESNFGRSGPGDFSRRLQLNLWDSGLSEKPLARLELPRADAAAPPGSTASIGFSPDGEKVAIGYGSHVAVYSTRDGSLLGKVDTQTTLTAVAIGPNDLLATAGGGNVRFWDLRSEITFISSITPTQNFVTSMRFSPVGSVLAMVGRDDPTIELIDPIGRSQIAILRASDRVAEVAFASDGRTLAAGGQGTTTTVWRIVGSTARIQLSGFDEPASAIAFRKDGFLAVGTTDGEIWGSRMQTTACDTPCTPLVGHSPQPRNGNPAIPQMLATRTLPMSAATSPFDRPAVPDRDTRPNRDRPHAVVLAYDDRDRLVVAHDSDAPHLRFANVDPQAVDSRISLSIPRQNGPPRGFQFLPALSRSADGHVMLVSRASRYYLWKSDDPEKLLPVSTPGTDREPTPPSDPPTPAPGSASPQPQPLGRGSRSSGSFRYGWARIAPDGRRIYVIDSAESGTPQAWDLLQVDDHVQTRRYDWPSPPRDSINQTLSPDGSLLAIANRGGEIALVDTQTLQVSGTISPADSGSTGSIQTMAFSPDGRTLAVATQLGPILLWNIQKAASTAHSAIAWKASLQLRLPVQRAPVKILAFDAKGTRLAGAGNDPLVEVWNLGEIRRELSRLGLDD